MREQRIEGSRECARRLRRQALPLLRFTPVLKPKTSEDTSHNRLRITSHRELIWNSVTERRVSCKMEHGELRERARFGWLRKNTGEFP